MKIVITGRDFSTSDRHALDMLIAAGHEVIDHSDKGMGSGTKEEIIYEAVKDADIVITGLEPYRDSLLKRCPNLKLISRRGIGYDSVDLDACKRYGITLTRTAGTVEGAVAEQVLAYILYFARRLDIQNASMHQGEWKRTMMPGAKSRTLGLVGFGGVGKEIAKRAVPFGMNVLYNCRHPKKEWDDEYGVSYMELDQMLAVSDYISVNVPLTDSTRGMFNKSMFDKMKSGSIFINIARGPVMDAAALKDSLDTGKLAGAAVDVFDYEPCTDSPLISCENVVLTPHTAPYTSENFIMMNEMSAQNVLDHIAGNVPEKNLVFKA
ncbi:MAG: glyoxylate reductase [Clostridia bacterium]|nr:glyoxylate reductase [Clostridia bacterium]